jgi:transposase
MGRGRTHSREFKLEVVRQLTSGEKRPAQLCREHGLAESLLLRWRKEVEVRGEAAFMAGQPTEPERLARRVEELERFCGQLALENAVLKKALQAVPSRSGTR